MLSRALQSLPIGLEESKLDRGEAVPESTPDASTEETA
jgi:hypothetical protein